MEKWGYFQLHEKYRYQARLFILVLGVLKEDLGGFFNTKGSFKDGFWRTFYYGVFTIFRWIFIMNHYCGSCNTGKSALHDTYP